MARSLNPTHLKASRPCGQSALQHPPSEVCLDLGGVTRGNVAQLNGSLVNLETKLDATCETDVVISRSG